MSEVILARRDIRILLVSIFVDTESLIAFIIDFFPAIAVQLSTGMDRIRIENLLLQKADLQEITFLLKSYHGQTVAQYLQQRPQANISGADSGPQTINEKSLPGEMQAELDALRRDKVTLLVYGASTDRIDNAIRKLRSDLNKIQQATAHEILQERYRLTEIIAVGHLSYIWLAYDRSPSENQHSRVAIRILKTERAVDQSIVNMFMNGGSIAYSFIRENSPENLLKLITMPMQQRGCYYYAMEYATEKDLYRAIMDNQIGTDAGIDIVLQIGRALGQLHAHSIVHRLVTPKNILLTHSVTGESLISGKLGGYDRLAKLNEDSFVSFSMRMPEEIQYAPPEYEASTNMLDPRSDIYGLSKVLLFVLMRKEISQVDKHRIDQVLAGLVASDRLRVVLQKALHPDLKHRFDSVDEFSQAVSSALKISSSSFPLLFSQSTEISVPPLPQNQVVLNIAESLKINQPIPLAQANDQHKISTSPPMSRWHWFWGISVGLSCLSIALSWMALRAINRGKEQENLIVKLQESENRENQSLIAQISEIKNSILKFSKIDSNDEKMKSIGQDILKIQKILDEHVVPHIDSKSAGPAPEATVAGHAAISAKSTVTDDGRKGKVCIQSDPPYALIRIKIEGQSKKKIGKAAGTHDGCSLKTLIPMNKTTVFYAELDGCNNPPPISLNNQSAWHEEKKPPQYDLKIKLDCPAKAQE